jgi:hypothetical protein
MAVRTAGELSSGTCPRALHHPAIIATPQPGSLSDTGHESEVLIAVDDAMLHVNYQFNSIDLTAGKPDQWMRWRQD